jgi:hypothetical protein
VIVTTVRLTKHQQRYLSEIWRSMPVKVRNQLTQESVRNIEIDPAHAAAAVAAITAERVGTRCKARRRILDALALALAPAIAKDTRHRPAF